MFTTRESFADALYTVVARDGVVPSSDPVVNELSDLAFEGVAVSEVADLMRLDGVRDRVYVDEYVEAVYPNGGGA
jgi:hypothetical protein